ncbi:MAG: hypothetical protein RRY65_04665 [Pseudoflavonifractor sp.]
MTNDEISVKLTEVDQRGKSNTRRIDKLEQSTDALNELTIAVKEMVLKQNYVADTVDKLDKKVEALEQKPAKRWDGLVDKIILTIVAALVGFVLARLGMV